MTKIRTTVLIAAVAAGALLLNRTIAAPDTTTKPASQGTVVAVCDVQKIMGSCKRAKKLNAEFRGHLDTLEKQADKNRQTLRDIQQSLKELSPGTEAFERQYRTATATAISLEIKQKTIEASIYRQYHIATLSLYKQITDTAGKLAKAKGIDLVIDLDARDPRGRSMKEIQQQISARNVLYAKENLDITADVLKAMDASFLRPDTKKGS